ncbi:MAG: adenosine deaminase, partial [Proteobacteria bacterium]|nr:adenosine deaminase [Pseudomonadota bacterium]
VELHIHLEGSMEPELMLELADKNNIKLPYSDLEAIRAAYHFKNLDEFVNLYLQATKVVQTAEDIYSIAMAYMDKCYQQNIQHTEIFCDIRTYVDRGQAAEIVIEGMEEAFKSAYKKYGITGGMIPCFVRHLGLETAEQDWQLLKPYKDKFFGIGLAAKEVSFPSSQFTSLFDDIRQTGLPIVAHAGEEGDASYIWSAIKDLKVNRIDHGVRCLDDPELVEYLRKTQIPLTVCPASNVSLHVFNQMSDHVIAELLDKGLNITINSDDPAHFNAYLTENLLSIQQYCGITDKQITDMAQNAINASFATDARKAELSDALNKYITSTEKTRL